MPTKNKSGRRKSTKKNQSIAQKALQNSLVRQRIFFFSIVLILVILTAILIWPFVPAIMLAVAMVVIMKGLYNKILNIRLIRGKESLASGITVAIYCLIVAAPFIFAGFVAITQAIRLVQETIANTDPSASDGFFKQLDAILQAGSFEQKQQIANAVTESVRGTVSWFISLIGSLGSNMLSLMTNAMITIVVMFVLFPLYRSPGQKTLTKLIPLPPAITKLYFDKANDMMVAMFKGVFIIAMVQGALMALTLLLAGVNYWLFLGILSMVLSVVPVLGIALIAWPAAILLMLQGQVWAGVFVLAMFLIVITNVDTVLRPKLVPKGVQINPALVILSVFGGLQLMGVVGALYGPVIMILLVTSIEVYTKYILRSDLELLLADKNDVTLKELGLDFDRSTSSKEEGGVMAFVGKFVNQILSKKNHHSKGKLTK